MVACHPSPALPRGADGDTALPGLGRESLEGEPVPSQKAAWGVDRQRRRTVVTTSGLPGEVGSPTADVGPVLGSPTIP